MKIVIEITPAEDNVELVQFAFYNKGKPLTMPVRRAAARMMMVVSRAYAEMLAESEYIKKELESESE